ncbi:winged helix-turn-helix domain-containing protein [Aedoeadaptatus urinae]|uniref:winged helix-turn-helix domain-containing protein n=1 Tax=Aedoeadaptatus urinae TaxID=1871017 RepID=UPI001F32E97A|nr:winged helix-turn-helix transcriptional regulator [Peptoniphilus urinae]
MKEFNGKTIQETTQKIEIEKPIPDQIVELIEMEPRITTRQIAKYLGISFDGVRYHMKKLRAHGVIKREGSTKAGKWIVLK